MTFNFLHNNFRFKTTGAWAQKAKPGHGEKPVFISFPGNPATFVLNK